MKNINLYKQSAKKNTANNIKMTEKNSYCLKCRKKQIMTDWKEYWCIIKRPCKNQGVVFVILNSQFFLSISESKNNRLIMQWKCDVCGRKKPNLLKNKKQED